MAEDIGTALDNGQIRRLTAELLARAPISLTQKEIDSMELAGFGLNNPVIEGAQIITLFSTARIAGKVIVLLPGQTLPEHRHVNKGTHQAKEEILRIAWGKLYLYTEGPGSDACCIPGGKEYAYSARTLFELEMNGQHIIPPGMKHWFTAGAEGCVLYSFSSAVLDSSDIFTDPSVVR